MWSPMSHYSRRFFLRTSHAVFVFLSASLLLTSCSSTSHQAESVTVPVLPQYVFRDEVDPIHTVKQAQEKALQANKLLLVVLGAQWCHDSTGLAQKFSTPSMQAILNERFETVFVDVGYYKDQRAVTALFNYPGYYATPLVMVVEPASSQLLNVQSLIQFNKADAISAHDYETYFATIALEKESVSTLSNHPDIADFSAKQTERLFNGFTKLQPLFKAAIEGELKEFDEIKALSEEIYQFRVALQKDIHWLHKQATLDEKSGQVCLLDFPSYGPFSWEQ